MNLTTSSVKIYTSADIEGVAVDAVVVDFIAGAAEALSPANSPDHWDIVEGQGSLFHPAYAGMTLGLLHGSQSDALVLCRDPTRQSLNGFPHMPVIPPEQSLAPYLAAGRLTNPKACFVGVSLNTSRLSEADAQLILRNTTQSMGLPCVDQIRTDVESIVADLETIDAR
jgi:uncharacterized NAD-dependent epimerase/dehydratase family protein